MSLSTKYFEQAQEVIPGGVNSPVRAFRSVGTSPLFISKGEGCYIFDVDGNKYIDCVMSWGPLLFGHAHKNIVSAISQSAMMGTSFGAPTEKETLLAKMICTMVPSIEKVRLVSSGTEAVMSAIRLARGFTKRDKIIKFEGCYHGHADAFLIKSGSGTLTHGYPSSPGIPQSVAENTLIARYNDISSVKELFKANPGQIASVIVEPVAGNMGVVLPTPDFLKDLRTLCTQEDAVLIFDEVITGFRLAKGGAQELYEVKPDMTTLGKIIGGGLPLAAFGGKREIMDLLAPLGPVYQAGTLSGNPCAVSAGIAMLELILHENPYSKLEQSGTYLFTELNRLSKKYDLQGTINHIGSMGCLFFGVKSASTYDELIKADTKKFAQFHNLMLNAGVYLAPSQFEAAFVSTLHSQNDLDSILKAAETSFKSF